MDIWRTQLRVYVLLTVYFYYWVECGPVTNDAEMVDYLLRFNYMNVDRRTGEMVTPDKMELAVKTFQKSVGLNVTGKLDRPTTRMMNAPRCGNGERVGTGSIHARRRRYALQGSKWPKTGLTYRVVRYSADMTKEQIDSELARAFKVWSDVSQLSFTRKLYGPVDIEISFVVGDHKDGNPFDGPSYTLAHAFYPQYGGNTHFDDDEQWLLGGGEGVNLFQVASHEFGHSIGLSHSDVPESLMAPIYRGYVPDFKLHDDDKRAAQILYGKPKMTVAPPTVTNAPPRPPTVRPIGDNPCLDGKIDAIISAEDGYTYAFRGRYYYDLDPVRGYVFQKPRLITGGWPGLPGEVDAALGNYKGHTYFFKGDKYWKFQHRTPDRGNPRTIKDHWPGIPDDVDAIFKWGGNGKVYAVKGRHYYKLDSIDEDYPRPLAVWSGLPKRIDAAMQWPRTGFTYFFSGPDYYRFNDHTFSVDHSYPKLSVQWWFDCPSQIGPQVGQVVGTDGTPCIGEACNAGIDDVWDLAGITSTKRQVATQAPTQMTCTAPSVGGNLATVVVLVTFSALYMAISTTCCDFY